MNTVKFGYYCCLKCNSVFPETKAAIILSSGFMPHQEAYYRIGICKSPCEPSHLSYTETHTAHREDPYVYSGQEADLPEMADSLVSAAELLHVHDQGTSTPAICGNKQG